MAQLKKLNGYEVVDETARNSKQNKVLYGDSDPSSSTGVNGDIYVSLSSSSVKNEIINLLYPIGSVITNSNSTFDPNVVYSGTTWVRIKGRVIVGVDEDDSALKLSGNTGGEKTHTLTVNEMPSHTHSVGAHSHGLNSHTHSYTKATGVAGHTLTVAEIPSHEHAINYKQIVDSASWPGSGPYYLTYNPNYDTGYIKATATGGGGSHSHGLNTSSANTGAASGSTANSSAFNAGSTTATNQNTGGGSAHNIMQPYITKYVWERTA